MSSSSSQYIATPPGAVLTEAQNPVLTEAMEFMTVDASSSSSSSSVDPYLTFILENIDLFRAYSMDADLVEEYFNKGVYFNTVDLDSFLSSSSSSSEPSTSFGLKIVLQMRSNLGAAVPEGLFWSVYDEELSGSPAPGMVQITRSDNKTLTVSISPSYSPELEDHISFRLNINHPDLTTSRTLFKASRMMGYSTTLILSNSPSGRRGVMSEEYKQYLIDWIYLFWSAWDAGDLSSAPPIAVPFPSSFIPFYPFAHALWKLKEQIGVQATFNVLSGISFSSGDTGLVANQNFLGVSQSVWNCMRASGDDLYYFDGYADFPPGLTPPSSFPRSQNGAYKDPDISFDCRSFAVLGAKFLTDQIKNSGICPKAEIKVIGIGTHYMVYVDLQGSGEESSCCKGQFLYEPADGSTYKDVKEFCDEDPGFCEGFDKTTTLYEPGKENSDGDFGDPNWEDDAGQLSRIEGVICGCLSGNYDSGTREAELKQVCESGQMQAWIANNLAFTSGDANAPGSQPGLSGPQVLACRHCVASWSVMWDCEADKWDDQFIFPSAECFSDDEMPALDSWVGAKDQPCQKKFYRKLSEMTCGQSADCQDSISSLPAPAPPAGGLPEGCCGSFCVMSNGANTGDCVYGHKDSWSLEKDEGRAGPFNDGVKCADLDCCPPGFRKVDSPTPMLDAQYSKCIKDCLSDPSICASNECCTPNPFTLEYECILCPDKTRSLRFDDQYPEFGKSPWG